MSLDACSQHRALAVALAAVAGDVAAGAHGRRSSSALEQTSLVEILNLKSLLSLSDGLFRFVSDWVVLLLRSPRRIDRLFPSL